MEIIMTRLAYAFATSLALAAPVAADSLNLLLPSLTFPTETVTTSTKGCDSAVATCQLNG
jgi:hypothetical protein